MDGEKTARYESGRRKHDLEVLCLHLLVESDVYLSTRLEPIQTGYTTCFIIAVDSGKSEVAALMF